jgi:hypothetical protein
VVCDTLLFSTLLFFASKLSSYLPSLLCHCLSLSPLATQLREYDSVTPIDRLLGDSNNYLPRTNAHAPPLTGALLDLIMFSRISDLFSRAGNVLSSAFIRRTLEPYVTELLPDQVTDFDVNHGKGQLKRLRFRPDVCHTLALSTHTHTHTLSLSLSQLTQLVRVSANQYLFRRYRLQCRQSHNRQCICQCSMESYSQQQSKVEHL